MVNGDVFMLRRAGGWKPLAGTVMNRLGLTLRQRRACLRNACKEPFELLGYGFGAGRS
jgi:hypothetical protein